MQLNSNEFFCRREKILSTSKRLQLSKTLLMAENNKDAGFSQCRAFILVSFCS